MTKRSNDKNITISSPKLTIALCGNPNSGKTTLFNQLTGSNQKVGNWPGVTVEQKSGVYKANHNVAIVDTPGIYSLSPFTIDEQVTQNYLINDKPNLVVNVVDSTNLERNLFLTSQLMDLDVPVVVALNMQDEAKAKGIYTNARLLEKKFGCKFFGISASKNQGVDELMEYCIAGNYAKKVAFTYSAPIEKASLALQSVLSCVDNKRWVTLKLLQNDKTTKNALQLTTQQQQVLCQIHNNIQKQLNDDVSATIAKLRYVDVSNAVSQAQTIQTTKQSQQKAQRLTDAIDKIVLNKWLAFPIFALVTSLIFYLSVGGLGGFLTNLINQKLTPSIQRFVANAIAPSGQEWLRSLVVDGVVAGVMSVVGFVPQITLLFGFISALEASGYMSRIAFITDRLLNKIGLGGRSFVSMILGCGCSVPAIMATRTIKNVNERNATITLTPFMPCSAKLAIISFFTTYLLNGNALFAISFYFLSILTIVLGGLILKVFCRKKTSAVDAFILELPTYRVPTASSVLKQMWDRGKAFLAKAGTIIFSASVLLWILQTFDFSFTLVQSNDSMLASIGKIIAPLFAPLGFNDGGCGWQFSVSALTGVVAKETVVTTLKILLPNGVANSISVLGAYCFVLYNLLTIPCVATISASFAEQGKWKNGAKSAIFQFLTAYLVTLVIYQVGTFSQKYPQAITVGVCCTAIVFALYFCLQYAVKHRGCTYQCARCAHNDNCKQNR